MGQTADYPIKSWQGDGALREWLNAISRFEVLEFVETNEGKAIRMFQSVNDRGIALSYIEKLKSLLIYYSNRLLNQELDEFINDAFGSCFRDFSVIRDLAGKKGFEVGPIFEPPSARMISYAIIISRSMPLRME